MLLLVFQLPEATAIYLSLELTKILKKKPHINLQLKLVINFKLKICVMHDFWVFSISTHVNKI